MPAPTLEDSTLLADQRLENLVQLSDLSLHFEHGRIPPLPLFVCLLILLL